MRQNEKSALRRAEFDANDEYQRRADNALAESQEIINDANRRLRKQGIRDWYFNLDGQRFK